MSWLFSLNPDQRRPDSLPFCHVKRLPSQYADHRLDHSEEGGALQRTRGFLISEEKAPLLQDDGHRLQRFSRTADVMAILALQHYAKPLVKTAV